METDLDRELAFPEHNLELNVQEIQEKPSDFPGKCEGDRPETPSSDASTSGVCSLASSDFDFFDENLDREKPVKDQEDVITCPVIIYQKRNLLDMFENLYPYAVYQTTSVPVMNMSNYWERRSVYHRLGPFGQMDEFDHQKCFLCDFYTTVPKRL